MSSVALRRFPWKLLLGIVCVALVLLAGTIPITHSHAQADLSHTSCGLCATAHVVADTVSVPDLQVAAMPVTTVELPPMPVRRRTPSRFALFIRPPPVQPSFA